MNRLHRWMCRSSFWEKFLQMEMLPWALKDVDLGQDLLEVGPGPGLTTDFLRTRFQRVTALEVDPALADSLKRRMSGTNVTVIQGDATALPFEDGQFSGAVAFTMLHHVPSTDSARSASLRGAPDTQAGGNVRWNRQRLEPRAMADSHWRHSGSRRSPHVQIAPRKCGLR